MGDEAYLNMVVGLLRGLSEGSDGLEKDRETIDMLFSLALAWDGTLEVELSNLVVDTLGKRVDDANRSFDRAIFVDIPTRFGHGAGALGDWRDGEFGATSRDRLSAAEHDAIIAAIRAYRDTMDLLAELVDLPFVPDEIAEKIFAQLAAIRRGSQKAVLGNLERSGRLLAARVLRENPIC